MTAEAIHAAVGSPIELCTALRERNFGRIRGTPYHELSTDVFSARDYVPPEGESVEAFERRVDLAWDEVVSRARRLRGDLAVVTHGLVCGSLLERVLAHREALGPGGPVVPNTSVTVVEPEPPWQVTLFACIAHLEQPEAGAGIA
jgi:broad specificity phosphatase PhoE